MARTFFYRGPVMSAMVRLAPGGALSEAFFNPGQVYVLPDEHPLLGGIDALGAVEDTVIDPTAPTFTASPRILGTPAEGETLTVAFGSFGFPLPTAAIQWQADGVDIPGATAADLPLGATEVGAIITVDVELSNTEGTITETATGVGPVTAVTLAPSFTVSPNISGLTLAGETLTVNYTAAGVPAPDVTIQWRDDGAPIIGATAATFDLTAFQVGGTITADVTLTSTAGTITETSPGVGPVTSGQAAPTFTSLPVITGTPTEGEALTLSFTVAGVPTPTVAVRWQDDGTDITGEISNTLTLTAGQVGGLITAIVEATNSAGSALETATGVGPVAPAGVAPTFTTSPTISGTPTQGETLSVTFTAEGVPAPSAAIQWQGDGVDISGATSSSLVLGSGRVGNTITARVTLVVSSSLKSGNSQPTGSKLKGGPNGTSIFRGTRVRPTRGTSLQQGNTRRSLAS